MFLSGLHIHRQNWPSGKSEIVDTKRVMKKNDLSRKVKRFKIKNRLKLYINMELSKSY